MTGFEFLAYVVAYVVAFAICLGLFLAIAGGIHMCFSHKKSFNDFLDRREKMGGNLNANSSVKEKR